ncbi:unnamed protein product [Fraxinus pennsylvanica]|uniref:DAHP synthetase I/KDSA domain-containing protein n=1 Tax=Fraxinus pennsylvanica TaxID=56036 RepID=A0AAD2E1Z9_9LAMI|nr:unnamed protein product [Fraxinus pennsylvanica]
MDSQGLASTSLPSNLVEHDHTPFPESGIKETLIEKRERISNGRRTLRVPKRMEQPIYVYYQLDNFYQNHRRYVKSRSDQQLRNSGDENDTSGCKPENTAHGMPIVPCGLIAWSLFNDTYGFTRNNQSVTINKREISWKSDRDHKFGKNVYPRNFQNNTLVGGARLDANKSLSEQEDLIVWMRTAALPTFRKLYGKIEMDLEAGDVINVELQNNYNTYSFDGKKKLVLSTTSWLGGKNDFLGIAYLVVGGLCFFLAIVFTIIYLVKPRQLGDPSYLSWNRNAGGTNTNGRITSPTVAIHINYMASSTLLFHQLETAEPFFLFAGPNVIESEDHVLFMAKNIKVITSKLGLPLVFKSSFDKANRSSSKLFRGPGLEEGLKCEAVGRIADIIQIPASLCWQVMVNSAEKIRLAGNQNVMVCERGTMFGYNDLIVGPRNFEWMVEADCPVVRFLARALLCTNIETSKRSILLNIPSHKSSYAVAVGVDGIFMEVHNEPLKAPVDGPTGKVSPSSTFGGTAGRAHSNCCWVNSYAAVSFLSFASSCLTSPAFLTFANISLNLSKSFREAFLFCTISFLPQKLFSHFLDISNNKSLFSSEPIDVHLDVGKRKRLKVHLAPHHMRCIHEIRGLVDDLNNEEGQQGESYAFKLISLHSVHENSGASHRTGHLCIAPL